jgi:hypothetical protein
MSETRRRTEERFEKRSGLWTKKNRPRQFLNTPRGNALTTDYIEYLADFLAGKHPTDQPDEPHPKFLREPVRQLEPHFLALAALAPLLDGIFRDWRFKQRNGLWVRDDKSWAMKLKLRVGDDIYQRLQGRSLQKKRWERRPRLRKDRSLKVILAPRSWGAEQRVQAGDWLLGQAMRLSIFCWDDDHFPRISDEWLPDVAQIRERLIAAKPSFAPLLLPPAPWTGSMKTYDDGFQAKFVRDWRPETETAIDDAFLNPTFEHARGVNALASVALKIDPDMLDLVKRFAVELMGNNGAKRRADKTTVAADVADAKWCVDHGTISNDYSCDRRGRIYALQHFNFAREDHVRSLFKFANGMRLVDGDTYWLEIHCANCEGSRDKESRDERREWVDEHRRDIKDIARDPVGTFDKWRGADKPFAFVAACRELAAAWADQENFVTHLPIGFDGSANGIQHLSLLSRDLETAALGNLLLSKVDGRVDENPSDVYATLIAKAIELILADKCDHAHWWRECFKTLSDKQQRKLLKAPIMTFAYSVTPPGAADQIEEVYGSFRQNAKPPRAAFRYLADKVLEACALLSGPKSVMDYICRVAEHCTAQKRFMEWTSPSGFPVSNRYQKPNMITVSCLRGTVRVAQHRIADGVTDEIRRKKVKSSAAPNFIHSLDAAHLIAVVNAAVSEGIMDILTVHDCFYGLAPQATRLHSIILKQLGDLYANNDPLAELRSRNVRDPDILPVPPKGTPWKCPGGSRVTLADGFVLEGRFVFSTEQLTRAKNAFG